MRSNTENVEETDSAGEGIKKEGRKRRHREEARIWRGVAEEMLAELVYCTCMQISLCICDICAAVFFEKAEVDRRRYSRE